MPEYIFRTKRAVADIVFAYRHVAGDGNKPLSYRDFAASLREILVPQDKNLSHQTIKNWEDRVHLPRAYYVTTLVLHAPNDWRKDFAEDTLAALHPDDYKPSTDIGRRALQRSLMDTGPIKLRYDTSYINL